MEHKTEQNLKPCVNHFHPNLDRAKTGELSMNSILTIGYEGSTIEDFVATLERAAVQVLIDIRAVAASRKRGFSKKSLAATLEEAGVEYIHLRGLGDPKQGRQAARRGDMHIFERIFRTHMEGGEAQEALDRALEVTSNARACLLCFERDHSGCHRSIVAQEMANRKAFEIRHLGVTHGLAEKARYGNLENGRIYAFGGN